MVCEQTFTFLNKFKYCKTMNSGRFQLFMLYVIDVHNLKLSGTGKNGRLKEIKPEYVPAVSSSNQNKNINARAVDDLADRIGTIGITTDHPCDECKRTFSKKEGLTRHKIKIHQAKQVSNDSKLVCDVCHKTYASVSTLNRHKRDTKCKDGK